MLDSQTPSVDGSGQTVVKPESTPSATSTATNPDQEIMNKLRKENEAMRKKQTDEMLELQKKIDDIAKAKAASDQALADIEKAKLAEQGKYKEMYDKEAADKAKALEQLQTLTTEKERLAKIELEVNEKAKKHKDDLLAIVKEVVTKTNNQTHLAIAESLPIDKLELYVESISQKPRVPTHTPVIGGGQFSEENLTIHTPNVMEKLATIHEKNPDAISVQLESIKSTSRLYPQN